MTKEELKPIDVSKYTVTENGNVIKDKLKQEAEEYLNRQALCKTDNVSYLNIKNLVIGFAEPREKRIAELEKRCANYEMTISKMEKGTCDICKETEKDNRIVELEEEISNLLSCKNCPENKGGYICAKEYENKCLAQKMQYIKELQEENAEQKEQLKTSYRKGMRHMAKALKDYDRTDGAWTDYFEHTVDKVLQREQVDFEENCTLVDQITKAKELLRKFMPYVREAYLKQDISNIKLSLDEITEAEQFFKYSEVEK